MLTGLIDETKGKATCFDIDMFENPKELRRLMGVCPQHDILFDFLTPVEHLQIFYDFKGGDPALK
jgi:ABC-type multidrug transport system ATPase subunit